MQHLLQIGHADIHLQKQAQEYKRGREGERMEEDK